MAARERDSGRTEIGATTPLPRVADLRAGTRLAAYELEEVVGRGAMGVVYRARHVHLDRVVALKLLMTELAADPAFRERFLREARLAASLHHPAVVTVYDAGESDGALYLAMQYIEGRDLARVVAEEAPLEPTRALHLLEQVAEGLDAAHARGLVHRDVKPANILVAGDRCYLGDFGLTRAAAATTSVTSHGQLVGTVEYMAPEQIEGTVVDRRTDVYALGCVLYQILTGRVPFERDSQVALIYAHLREPPPAPSRAVATLPATLDDVVARALAKVKEDRFGSCGELVAAARAALEARPAAAAEARVMPAPPSVLVAEPDAALRGMIRATLARAGYSVRATDDVSVASAAVGDDPPDLLVAGARIADTLVSAAAAAGAGTRVLVVGDRSGRRGASAGDAAIGRPFSSLQLLMTVDELVPAGSAAARTRRNDLRLEHA